MPIEIKEMHIKIVVGENSASTPAPGQDGEDNEQRIIEACVEQVMEILAKKDER